MTQQPVDLGFDDDAPREEAEVTASEAMTLLRPVAPAAIMGRTLPHSIEAEQYLLSCILIPDSTTLDDCIERELPPQAFYAPANRLIYEHLLAMRRSGQSPDVAVLAEELKKARQLKAVGGFAYLIQVSSSQSTTANATYFIQKLTELYQLRELIRVSTNTVERAFEFDGQNVSELIETSSRSIAKLDGPKAGEIQLTARPITDFNLPKLGDPSILIGNRWISRGDIAIMASTSGMGKSSLSIQSAMTWALGLPLFDGMKPNGPIKSLIFQAEDGEGDVAEVRLSIEHAMGLTPDQIKQVRDNVLIVTDRVHRGLSFRAELKAQIELHHPDIVWINPLLAFLKGDVNSSTDIGEFLREQLNSLNEPATFAYVIVHHTAKPPKEKAKRQWNEVMYEMAGSADLTNAARAVICLQATDNQGEFKLILAKRGIRAGLTERKPGTVNPEIMFDSPTATISVRHSTERMPVPGATEVNGFIPDMPVIFWERFEPVKEIKESTPSNAGRPSKYQFEDYKNIFPAHDSDGAEWSKLHRLLLPNGNLPKNNLHAICKRWEAEGMVEIIDEPNKPRRYRKRM